MDALTMLLFALFTTPIALVTRDPHFREDEGLVSGMMWLESSQETATLPLERPIRSFDETPVAW
jgi:hypothetical protein